MNEECPPYPLMTREFRTYLLQKNFRAEGLVNKFTLAINYLLVALLTMPSTAIAQTAARYDPAWERVKALPYNEPLIVMLKGRATVEGTLISASDTHLRMYKVDQTPSGDILYQDIVDIRKANILTVYRIEKKSSKKLRFIGATVGAAIGTATETTIGNMGDNCQPRSGTLGGVLSDVCGGAKTGLIELVARSGSATGTYVENLFGRDRLKRVTIYKSK
jgi:hypothetical protein